MPSGWSISVSQSQPFRIKFSFYLTHVSCVYSTTVTRADREGRAAAFADTYASSPLALENSKQLERYLSDTTPLPEHLEKELAVQHDTNTPFWWGLKTIVSYRTPRNYKDPEFLGPRVGDKFLMTTLMWTLYWDLGRKFAPENYVNQVR